MKFTTHLSGLMNLNAWLKLAVVGLGAFNLLSSVVICALAMREPFVVERACISKAVSSAQVGVTAAEVTTFIQEVLPQRFNTDNPIERAFFEEGEVLAKEKEQGVLREKSIHQRLLVSEVQTKDNMVLVKAERLISVGDIRSVLPLNVRVTISRESRTNSNPYGLVVLKVEPAQAADKKER